MKAIMASKAAGAVYVTCGRSKGNIPLRAPGTPTASYTQPTRSHPAGLLRPGRFLNSFVPVRINQHAKRQSPSAAIQSLGAS
jgi:hypothetical protein